MKCFLPIALTLSALVPITTKAQVGIGTTSPDTKSALDIRAADKGLLIPRLTATQRANIASPPQGLMVYQTDGSASGGPQSGFWYYVGTGGWVFLNPTGDDLGNHTATQNLNLQGNALTGTGSNLGGTVGLGVRADGGLNLGQNTSGNLLIGYQAGQANTSGYHNQFSGYQSGAATTGGSENLFSGYKSGYFNQGGSNNLFSGSFSGYSNLSGYNNLYSGYNSGYTSQTGHDNVFLGHISGQLSTGSFNVLLGSSSGFYDTGSNLLTALGYGSGPANGSPALTNATALGANVSLTTSNTVVLGNNASVGIGTSAPSQKLEVVGNIKLTGTAGTDGLIFPDGTKQTTAATSGGGSLTLPYSGTTNNSSPAFAVSNTGTGQALSGTATGNGTAAVRGESTNPTSGSGTGVLGLTVSGYGVRGTASGTNGYGVAGEATDSRGVSGTSGSGPGLYGRSTSGLALQAQKTGGDLGRVAELTNTNASNDSTALYVSTPGDQPAVRAVNTSTSAQAAIRGVKQSASTDGIGVEGVVTSGATGNAAGVRGLDQSGSGGGSGVIGLTAGGYGVRGIATANGGYGVSGSATNSYGVIGGSQSGIGVYGSSNTGSGIVGTTVAGSSGTAGVVGSSSNAAGIGVLGTTVGGSGVRGTSSGSGGYGLEGSASANGGIGVVGVATGAATALAAFTTGTGRAASFSQANSSSSSPAVVISQSGNGLALDVAGGPIRTAELNSPSTGGANLMPVAYGRVSRTGTILGGTGNFTVVQSLPNYGVYVITISNLSAADLTNAVCQVTCRYGVPGQPNAEFTATANGQTNGRVEVHVSALSTPFDLAEADFTFVVYRP
jgi:hypothetical protein